jgi:hypothetical protein
VGKSSANGGFNGGNVSTNGGLMIDGKHITVSIIWGVVSEINHLIARLKPHLEFRRSETHRVMDW